MKALLFVLLAACASDDAPILPTCAELGCADVAFCPAADADACTCVVDGEPLTCDPKEPTE